MNTITLKSTIFKSCESVHKDGFLTYQKRDCTISPDVAIESIGLHVALYVFGGSWKVQATWIHGVCNEVLLQAELERIAKNRCEAVS